MVPSILPSLAIFWIPTTCKAVPLLTYRMLAPSCHLFHCQRNFNSNLNFLPYMHIIYARKLHSGLPQRHETLMGIWDVYTVNKMTFDRVSCCFKRKDLALFKCLSSHQQKYWALLFCFGSIFCYHSHFHSRVIFTWCKEFSQTTWCLIVDINNKAQLDLGLWTTV